MQIKSTLLASALAAFALAAPASAITYTVDRVIDGGTVTGKIQTTGALGVLVNSDIVDISLSLTSSQDLFTVGVPTDTVSSSDRGSPSLNGGITATLTDLFFDFGSTTISFFQNTFTGNGWCLTGSGFGLGCAPGASPGEESVFFTTSAGIADTTARSGVVAIASVVAPVPVPASLPLIGVAVAAFGLMAARRKRKVV